jgi:photosystem II PsbU protein
LNLFCHKKLPLWGYFALYYYICTHTILSFSFLYCYYYYIKYNSTVAAFVAPNAARASTQLAAEDRRAFFSSAAAVVAGMVVLAPSPANAIRDYEDVGLLGGSNIVDINNANVRVYLKMPGLYPTVAGKIVTNAPYKTVSEIYSIPGLTSAEKDLMKKYESRFATREPSADYVVDMFNNGLYK